MVRKTIGWKKISLRKFFQRIVESNEMSIQDVKLMEQVTWVEKAQNFNSNIISFTVKYTYIDDTTRERMEKCVALVLKEEPLEELRLIRVRQSRLFETEIDVLKNVIPKIECLIKRQISPKLIYSSKKKSFIIMENLSNKGFQLKDCKMGLSLSHTLMVIEILAKFHAGSVKLNEMEPEILPRFNRYDLSENTHENIRKNIEFCTRAIGKVIGDLPNAECVRIAPKFEKLANEISHKLSSLTKYNADEFCVLNHGDCWFSNIMFHESECGEPNDVRLIDFQLSVWSSPAIDLLFFLSICPELGIKCKRDDDFLEHYINILSTTMRNLGCRTRSPTMEELKRSMHKRRAFAVKCGLIFHSKLMAGGKCETIEDILKNSCSNMEIFRHPATIESLMEIVPLMDDNCYLD